MTLLGDQGVASRTANSLPRVDPCRTFTLANLPEMITIAPLPSLLGFAAEQDRGSWLLEREGRLAFECWGRGDEAALPLPRSLQIRGGDRAHLV